MVGRDRRVQDRRVQAHSLIEYSIARGRSLLAFWETTGQLVALVKLCQDKLKY